MPHSKVFPSKEMLCPKSMDIGHCIIISPTNLGSSPEKSQEENVEDVSPHKESIKHNSPVQLEQKGNVSYSSTLPSPVKPHSQVTAENPKQGPTFQSSKSGIKKYLSFGSADKTVQSGQGEGDWRRKSVVSKDFSTGSGSSLFNNVHIQIK